MSWKFWKKKKEEPKVENDNLVMIDGEEHYVDDETNEYIRELRVENIKLKEELIMLKPLLEKGEYDPPRSKECIECDYVVVSPWTGVPVGCRKNLLCDDFKKRET